MMIIVYLSSVVVVTIGVTFAYIKIMDYVQKNYPTYIGDGLRNRLVSYLGLSKPRSKSRNYHNNNIIPANIVRKHQSSFDNVSESIVIHRVAQCGRKQVSPREYSHYENGKTNRKQRSRYFEYCLCHIKRIVSRRIRRCNQKQIKPSLMPGLLATKSLRVKCREKAETERSR